MTQRPKPRPPKPPAPPQPEPLPLRLRGLGTMAITRTHLAYHIDLWTDDEEEVVEHLADVDDLTAALATYHAAIERWPGKAITLRQGRHVIEDSRRSRLATLFSFPWSDKPFHGSGSR
jgi:hypothetical protein